MRAHLAGEEPDPTEKTFQREGLDWRVFRPVPSKSRTTLRSVSREIADFWVMCHLTNLRTATVVGELAEGAGLDAVDDLVDLHRERERPADWAGDGRVDTPGPRGVPPREQFGDATISSTSSPVSPAGVRSLT